MTPHEFYEQLRAVAGENSIVTLTTGESMSLRVSEHDAMAAKLLLWLEEEMPDADLWDLFEVLDAAHWWATFWSSLVEDAEDVTLPDPPKLT